MKENPLWLKKINEDDSKRNKGSCEVYKICTTVVGWYGLCLGLVLSRGVVASRIELGIQLRARKRNGRSLTTA